MKPLITLNYISRKPAEEEEEEEDGNPGSPEKM